MSDFWIDGQARAGQAPEPRKRCSPSWARLIAKVYQVDPLVCAHCGQRMSLIAFVTDQMAIGKILDHLGLSTPPTPLFPVGVSVSFFNEYDVSADGQRILAITPVKESNRTLKVVLNWPALLEKR